MDSNVRTALATGEDWLPLLSDWDLDIAILSAADPHLHLMISDKKIRSVLSQSSEEAVSSNSSLDLAVEAGVVANAGGMSNAKVASNG